MTTIDPPSTPPGIWPVCKEGFRRNRFPALVLQIFAGGMLALYFLVPALRPAFEEIGKVKASWGIRFSVFSTAFFGGIIPWLVLVHRGRIPAGLRLKHLGFQLFYWGQVGFMVDRFYTLQTQLFGSGNDFKTLFVKMLVDQLAFNLLWATPIGVLLFGWRNAGFSWRKFRADNSRQRLIHTYWTIQISAWVVWVPAVFMIYSLPPDLQIPLFNLVLCFFSLVLTFVSRSP